jgi:hypothetical protein
MVACWRFVRLFIPLRNLKFRVAVTIIYHGEFNEAPVWVFLVTV